MRLTSCRDISGWPVEVVIVFVGAADVAVVIVIVFIAILLLHASVVAVPLLSLNS